MTTLITDFPPASLLKPGEMNRNSGGQGAGHAIHVRLSIHVILSLCGRVPCYARIHRAMTMN